jgi:hypothetical protein
VLDGGLALSDQSRIPVDNGRAAAQYRRESPLNPTLRTGIITSLCAAHTPRCPCRTRRGRLAPDRMARDC